MISTQNVMKYISRKQTSQMRRADWMLRKLCDWLTLWSPTFFWIRYHHAFFGYSSKAWLANFWRNP